MRILSYSPSFEVYVAAEGKDGTSYYDLSKDASSCSVSRVQDGVSSCSVRILNENGKYNGRIRPMDRITIFASKRESRVQIFAGYITSVPAFTLYPEDYQIKGMCSLYQLQKLYWDPGLYDSAKLIAQENPWNSYDANASDMVSLMLENVAGWQRERIAIQPSIPSSVEDFARELYAAQAEDIGNLQDMIKQFNDMLATTNLASGGSSYLGGGGGTLEDAVLFALKVADDPSVGYSQGSTRNLNPDVDCSSLVWNSLVRGAGFDAQKMGGSPFATGTMTPILEANGFRKVAWGGSASELARGDIMWVHGSNVQHTEIYIGEGKTVGALINEFGGILGGQPGDQTGTEVCVSPLSSMFTHYFRYEGGDKK